LPTFVRNTPPAAKFQFKTTRTTTRIFGFKRNDVIGQRPLLKFPGCCIRKMTKPSEPTLYVRRNVFDPYYCQMCCLSLPDQLGNRSVILISKTSAQPSRFFFTIDVVLDIGANTTNVIAKNISLKGEIRLSTISERELSWTNNSGQFTTTFAPIFSYKKICKSAAIFS